MPLLAVSCDGAAFVQSVGSAQAVVHREAASAELDAGLLLEVHVALQRILALGIRTDLYQPMADAIWNLYDWLRALGEGNQLIAKGYESSERVWGGAEVSVWSPVGHCQADHTSVQHEPPASAMGVMTQLKATACLMWLNVGPPSSQVHDCKPVCARVPAGVAIMRSMVVYYAPFAAHAALGFKAVTVAGDKKSQQCLQILLIPFHL